MRDFFIEIASHIDYASGISFLLGIFFGVLIVTFIYLILVMISLKDSEFDPKKLKTETVNIEDIEALIKGVMNTFKQESKKMSASDQFSLLAGITTNLVNDIATLYYPESKYPLLELSIDEIIELNRYVIDRVDQIMSKRGLKIFRKIKASQIVYIMDVKRKVDESRAVQVVKKYKVTKVVKYSLAAINLFNPIYWGRKIVINKGFDIAVRKLCSTIIGVIGEETTKVYSKNVFNKQISIDVNSKEYDIEDLGDKLLIEEVVSSKKG